MVDNQLAPLFVPLTVQMILYRSDKPSVVWWMERINSMLLKMLLRSDSFSGDAKFEDDPNG